MIRYEQPEVTKFKRQNGIVPLTKPFELSMEVDEYTGQMLFPSDGITKRFDYHIDQITDWKRFDGADTLLGIRAVIQDNVLLAMARELLSIYPEGYRIKPRHDEDELLEDWVNDRTDDEYEMWLNGLFWCYKLEDTCIIEEIR